MLFAKLPPILELYEKSGDSIEAQDSYYNELENLGILSDGAGRQISLEESMNTVFAIMNSEFTNDEQYCLLRVLEVDLENHAEDRTSIDYVLAAQYMLTEQRNAERNEVADSL